MEDRSADWPKAIGKRGEEGSDVLVEEAMRYDVGGSSKRVWSEELRTSGLSVPWDKFKV